MSINLKAFQTTTALNCELGDGACSEGMNQSPIRILSEPGSDLIINLSPTERILRRTSLVSVGEHRCPPNHPFFRHGGGPQTCPYIGFMRSTVIREPEGRKAEVHTPNAAGFHAIGSSYTRQVVDDAGDRSDWIAISPKFLVDLIEDCWEQGGESFPAPFAPVTLGVYLAQRRLVEMLNSNVCLSDLAFEEYVTRIVMATLREAFRFWDGYSKRKGMQRPTCERRRVGMVEAVKQHIATQYWTNQSLQVLARSAHCSAGQLARVFPVLTGFSIHGYQQNIRLRASLQLLREAPLELAMVAAELGFANHSHFSTVFKRQFGISPSQFAKNHSRSLMASFLDSLDRSVSRGLAGARSMQVH
jgi:AraC family transcriptional regulator